MTTATTTRDEIKALVRRAAECQDRGDLEGFLALLAPDYRLHVPGQPAPEAVAWSRCGWRRISRG